MTYLWIGRSQDGLYRQHLQRRLRYASCDHRRSFQGLDGLHRCRGRLQSAIHSSGARRLFHCCQVQWIPHRRLAVPSALHRWLVGRKGRPRILLRYGRNGHQGGQEIIRPSDIAPVQVWCFQSHQQRHGTQEGLHEQAKHLQHLRRRCR